MSLAMTLGRMLFVIMFIVSGLSKLFDLAATANSISTHILGPYAAYLTPLAPYLAQVEGMTGMTTAHLLALLAGVFEVAGGLLIAFDLGVRWLALLFIAYTLIATATYHDFWNMAGAERLNNMIHAMKNLSIIGALLMLASLGGRESTPPRMRGSEV
jgi:uncharacterized membrane protein YphA (DoxX/SURF4 family)